MCGRERQKNEGKTERESTRKKNKKNKKTLNICKKKNLGKGRGHIIEGHHSLCWRRRFSLSRSFVVLAEDPKHPRCSTFWERVRVCVCVCVSFHHNIIARPI